MDMRNIHIAVLVNHETSNLTAGDWASFGLLFAPNLPLISWILPDSCGREGSTFMDCEER